MHSIRKGLEKKNVMLNYPDFVNIFGSKRDKYFPGHFEPSFNEMLSWYISNIKNLYYPLSYLKNQVLKFLEYQN